MTGSSSPLSSISSTTPQSHVSSQPSPFATSTLRSSGTVRKYRAARALPYELQERCRIYLEEALYVQALVFLQSVLLQGSSVEDAESVPAFVPPASHIAFICTLVVHPSLNTRTNKSDKIQASNLAIQYLHSLQHTVGPLQGNFSAAYTFPNSTYSSRRGLPGRNRTASPEKYVHDAITSDLAGPKSLWAQAGDFWAAVGWAFNCSVVHKKRWSRWQLWLEHMLEILERDWEVRSETADLKQSLFLSFSSAENDSRRIIRAIFADGSKKSLQEFKEIWKNETSEKKEKALEFEKVKIGKIDIDSGEFGDYFNASSDDESSSDEGEEEEGGGVGGKGESIVDGDKPESSHAAPTTEALSGSLPNGALPLGGYAALTLRTRLFAALCNLALALPDSLTDIRSLFDHCISQIRSYPLLTFSAVLSPSSMRPLTLAVASAFLQYLARSLLESAAPPPMIDDLSQESLEECYLPWAANTNGVAENAKLGACIEYLVRMFDREVGLKWSEHLRQSVEEGVRRREDKARRAGRKKGEAGTASSDVDLAWMRASGQRLKVILQVVQAVEFR